MKQAGTEGLFDAFLFLTIISIASCIVIGSMSDVLRLDDSERRDAAIKYAATSLDAILSTTMRNASYSDRDGSKIELRNCTTIREFLLDETFLLLHGWSQTSFEESNRFIERLARKLITPAYRYALVTGPAEEGDNYLVMLGDDIAPVGYASSSSYVVHDVNIKISLVLWWA